MSDEKSGGEEEGFFGKGLWSLFSGETTVEPGSLLEQLHKRKRKLLVQLDDVDAAIGALMKHQDIPDVIVALKKAKISL